MSVESVTICGDSVTVCDESVTFSVLPVTYIGVCGRVHVTVHKTVAPIETAVSSVMWGVTSVTVCVTGSVTDGVTSVTFCVTVSVTVS